MHSNVQMTASREFGGKSLSQHSQLGLNSSIKFSVLVHDVKISRSLERKRRNIGLIYRLYDLQLTDLVKFLTLHRSRNHRSRITIVFLIEFQKFIILERSVLEHQITVGSWHILQTFMVFICHYW